MTTAFRILPSVDEVMRGEAGRLGAARFGHAALLEAVRAALGDLRAALAEENRSDLPISREDAANRLAEAAIAALERADAPRLRRVFNLTGTVLHTNLGRAIYAEEAVAAATVAMRHPVALEFEIDSGRRGERDDAVRGLVTELTGAEDACFVNNNAAAVLLTLAALGGGRETILSRGELIEIGGSFRMPAIMASAGTRLVEVGTTNRTHLADYADAIRAETALIMKVHTSNYVVQGFTRETTAAELAPLAREKGIPLVDDLGSGTFADLSRWGLKRERTVQDALADGADLVTFSGDKLLGGPQAGFIIGRRDLVRACARHPIKRAVRLDKVRLAALEATLKLYRDPDRLAERLPTLAFFTRTTDAIRADAEALAPALAAALGASAEVTIVATVSQIGSGALPLETIPSVALRLAPPTEAGGSAADRLAAAFRRLPIAVVGRVEKGALLLDLRCLDDLPGFLDQIPRLGQIAGEGG